MRDDNWDDMRVALSVGRCLSFAGAARRLGVNESTVARRLARTERRLGTRLFERSDGRLMPTDAGTDLIRTAETMELHVQTLQNRVSGIDDLAAGTVRVTTVPVLANRLLAPALADLVETHPLLRIELIADPRDLSLTRREADIALRLARPSADQRAIARRIATLDYALYASVDADASALPFLGYEETMAALPQSAWLDAEIARAGAGPSPVRVNDAETLLHCLKAGIGKSLLPVFLGEAEPDLVRIETGAHLPSRELWLMVHADLRDLVRIKAAIAWILDTIQKSLQVEKVPR